MKSSQGEYFVGLDHIRALAAFTVFAWHFNHVNDNHFGGAEMYPLSLLAEGHVGVAIFMVLSGYLFAKLLDGRRVRYLPFLWNRIIRLFPLLIVVFALRWAVSIGPDETDYYLKSLIWGFIWPVWPNGGWSIAVELHFYIILPLLLAISSRKPSFILLAIVASICTRTLLWVQDGTVQHFAYWTIIGGIDQFVLGIFAFKMREHIQRRHVTVAGMMACLCLYMTYFDAMGGFYRSPDYPSPSAIWIIHPTLLAVSFSALIAWYDTSFAFRNTGVSALLATIGASSYSIYLLHFFVVFHVSEWIDDNIIELTSFPVILAVAVLCFLCFTPIAYLSYRLIELPPLKYRMRYKHPETDMRQEDSGA